MSSTYSHLKRVVAAGSISVVGIVVMVVPVYDTYDAAILQGEPLGPSVLENFVLVVLASVLIGTGVWLHTRDWEDARVTRTAMWCVGGAVGFTLALSTILWIQQYIQGEYRPLVVAGGAVVIGSIGMFATGIYDSSRIENRKQLALERNRFSSLFENSNDAVASASFSGDGATLLETNEAFDRSFDTIDPLVERIAETYEDKRGYLAVHEEIARGNLIEVTIDYTVDETEREFVVQVVPYGDQGARAFLVATDVTEQTELAKKEAARNRTESLHDIASEIAAATSLEETYDLTLDAVDDVLGSDAAVVCAGSDIVATRGTETVLDREALAEIAEDDSRVKPDGGARIASIHDRDTLTVPFGEYGVFQAASDELTEADISAAEVLLTHVDVALERLEYERTVREERDRLELLNNVLYEDIRDGIETIQNNAEPLEDHLEDEHEAKRATIAEEATQMKKLLKTTQSFTEGIDAGSDPSLDSAPIDEVFQRQLEAAWSTFPDASIRVEGHLPTASVDDGELVGELLENLLSNAVIHNDNDDPRVAVSATVENGTAVISVGDDGPGIPDGESDRFFQRGETGEESDRVGLGLYLSRQILETHGGSIDVGESEFGGAAFTVRVPLSKSRTV